MEHSWWMVRQPNSIGMSHAHMINESTFANPQRDFMPAS